MRDNLSTENDRGDLYVDINAIINNPQPAPLDDYDDGAGNTND